MYYCFDGVVDEDGWVVDDGVVYVLWEVVF